jgi:hypothetical protein
MTSMIHENEGIDRMTKSVSDFENLEEGNLYAFKRGELHEIETDPDDVMKKVKITESAFTEVIRLQRRMRKEMQGYKPDIHLICSALIEHVAQRENAREVVRQFCLQLFNCVEK